MQNENSNNRQRAPEMLPFGIFADGEHSAADEAKENRFQAKRCREIAATYLARAERHEARAKKLEEEKQ